MLAALLKVRKKDSLWILFRDVRLWRERSCRLQIGFLTKALQWRLKNRLVFFSDSDLVASFFSKKLKATNVVPIPHTDFPSQTFVKPSLPLKICFMGIPRREKGVDVILSLMALQASKISWIVSPEDMKEKIKQNPTPFLSPIGPF